MLPIALITDPAIELVLGLDDQHKVADQFQVNDAPDFRLQDNDVVIRTHIEVHQRVA